MYSKTPDLWTGLIKHRTDYWRKVFMGDIANEGFPWWEKGRLGIGFIIFGGPGKTFAVEYNNAGALDLLEILEKIEESDERGEQIMMVGINISIHDTTKAVRFYILDPDKAALRIMIELLINPSEDELKEPIDLMELLRERTKVRGL